jgi:two-component system CheB/CheR fusion protein
MEALLGYINERRNFDFRGYKRASLGRRIFKRMQQIGVDSYQRYIEVLEANPGEFGELFNTILINVTSLIRDSEAWEVVADSVIPSILQSKGPEDPIRVWSAGCASGEEAYSLAVLLADAAGEERFRQSVKIYATDADSDALIAARHGRYKEKDLLEAFGDERAHRYFEFDSGFGTFRSDLRRSLIFGRHDLVQDPPISRLDLVACRNTLMYFTSQVQLGVLATLHFALNPGGYLFLGKSEALVSRTDLFEIVDLRNRVFRKDGTVPEMTLLPSLAPVRGRSLVRADAGRLAETVLEHTAIPQLVVDGDSSIVLANREARTLLGLGSSEVGRPLREAALGIRMADLKTPLEQAIHKRQPVTVNDVVCDSRRDLVITFDVVIAPLDGPGGAVLSFVDVSRYQPLRDELERSQRELESAYEELQSAVEELETTNEELQSTNEELETTNEELHSTNEELETMNEELQSTNEELETINNELRERSTEVEQLNRFLESILGSLQSTVIVLDREMQVLAWNRQAEDLWGLRNSEVVGQHFLNLDIGFPVDSLRSAIRACVSGNEAHQHLEQRAINRRGRPVHVEISVSGLAGDQSMGGVLILMDATPILEGAETVSVGQTDDSDDSGAD